MAKEKKQISSGLFFVLFIAAIVIIAVIANIFTGGTFLDGKNIEIIVSNSINPTFTAWAICFLFACGYTDLSLGAVIILGSFMTCAAGNAMFNSTGSAALGYLVGIAAGLATGALLVFINFIVFAYTKIPSWIAGICIAMVYEAISLYLFRTYKIFNTQIVPALRGVGQFPVSLIILIIGFVVVYIIYNRTSVGINIRAVGGNKEVSRVLGIKIDRTLIFVGLICGILVGIAAVLNECYNTKTTTVSGLTSIQTIFKPLAIALLAQVLEKKINIIIAVPFCSILIYGIFNLMAFYGVPSGTLQDVFLCAFLILFGAIGQRGVKEVVK